MQQWPLKARRGWMDGREVHDVERKGNDSENDDLGMESEV